MNIVIPMAGEGSRFKNEGYKKPKPFIDVAGKPMIMRVLDNLKIPGGNFILIGRKKHLEQENRLVNEIINNYNATFVAIEKLTEGTACTILYARKYINNDEPLLIANADQIVDIDITNFIKNCKERNLDGSILTFIENSKDSKWSYAKINDYSLVTEVKEKMAISEYATIGIYLFSKGKDFINSAIDMIVQNDRVNNEFYTCPVYNYMISENKSIGIFNIEYDKMHGIGTPTDLNNYLSYLGKTM
jgi:UDP-N-acetylglucosamine diphosphorylase / glucose-1-phosphate thymidylyltransferase / UDP-N-acetylgalactosamine diphosphorylase / glucosamine-1-phosphate N-acetyltransferase / galactosamine-1-phosphate N-acetyltransferase